MNNYRIEKVRCPVTVVLADGETVAGEIFLSPTSRFSAAPQEPVEFLNEDDAWFALATPKGARLVSKENVESVEVVAPAADGDGGALPHRTGIELRLVSGATSSGTVFIDTPPSRARLVDFLNSHRERFLLVFQAGRVTLVNRGAIVHVRELT